MMIRVFILVSVVCTALAASDALIAFYRNALDTLAIGKMANLESRRGDLAVSGTDTDRFSTLSLDMLYTHTNAKLLKQPYRTTDIVFSDTIDLFGKQRDTVEALRLESRGNLRLLDLQKQQLFIALTDLVVAYRKAEALYDIHEHFYQQQSTVLEQLRTGVKSGSFPRMDAGRFADALSTLEVQIIKEHRSIEMMKAQLALYAPGQPVPSPSDENVSADVQSFIESSPQLRYTTLHARALSAQASGTAKQWHPDLVAGAAYQFNDDPTANGDNYSFNAGIHFGFGGGLGDNAEAARIAALQANLETRRQRVEAQQQYLSLRSAYDTAAHLLEVLKSALCSAEKNAKTMQKAYLKHYVDFNAYLQTMQQLLSLQEQQIEARYQSIRSTQVLNALSQGAIYE